MRDMRSRRERFDDLVGGENSLHTFMMFVAFGLLLGWFWLVMDIEDNLPRLWRFLLFIFSLLPGGDTPMFSPERRQFMIVLAVVGTIVILWLAVRFARTALKASFIALSVSVLLIVATPVYALAVSSTANPGLTQAGGTIILLIAAAVTILLMSGSGGGKSDRGE